MLQQRQRALQKQRTASSVVGATPMVMANNGMPTSEATARTAQDRPTPSSMLASAPSPKTAGVLGPTKATCMGGGDRQPLLSNMSPTIKQNTLESQMSSMSIGDEEDDCGMVAPAPEFILDTKEDEAKRRSMLAQRLDQQGMSPVFDPTPQTGPLQGKITFDVASIDPSDMKSFLLNPAPKNGGMIECRIIRERTGLNKLYPKYTMETDAGVFLFSAKKQKHNKTSNYSLSMSKEGAGKDGDGFLGKLRSNFLGLEFVAYGTGLNPKKIDSSMSQVHAVQLARQELLGVQYSSSIWGGSKPRGPRKMTTCIPKVQASGERLMCRTLSPDTEGLLALQNAGNKSLVESFHNKPPKWNDQIGAFVLNFNKRVTQASVKNFQLTNDDDPDKVFLQFGRVGKDVFNIDFQHPFSPFQALAICLSSFDYKLCCE
jgi:hypothetical protein